MATLSIKQAQYANGKLIAISKAAGYMGAALLLALLFGLLLSGGDWTLPMDPAVSASFTA